MAGNEPREDGKLDLQATHLEEGFMVGEDRWQEIRRLHREGPVVKSDRHPTPGRRPHQRFQPVTQFSRDGRRSCRGRRKKMPFPRPFWAS